MSATPHRLDARALASVLAIAATTLPSSAGCRAAHESAHGADVVVFNDNGAWSWFEDERAIVDPANGVLLVSSVANGRGSGGAARHGNVEVATYDLIQKSTKRAVLHANLEADDHNSAALFVRRDGRYLAMYSWHDTDTYSRWRVGDETGWGPEHTFDHGAPTTYSNMYPTTPHGTGRLYGFVRSVGRDPHVLVSDDNGSTWSYGGRLLEGPGRPYVRYASDGAGRIHVIATEQHPDEHATSIFHGVIVDGRLLRSDGSVLDDDLSDHSAASPDQLTEVFTGDTDNRAWIVDLHVDQLGLPYAVFSVHSPRSQHRYYYARLDSAGWHVHLLAHAGGALYPSEPSYTGLAALHPHDPARVFISTDVHPATGDALISTTDGRRHHEIFEGATADRGANWTWTAVTANSTADNLRPIVPIWDDRYTALLWLRGTYTSYHSYDLDIVGIITDRSPSCDRARTERQHRTTYRTTPEMALAAAPGLHLVARIDSAYRRPFRRLGPCCCGRGLRP